MMIFVVSNHKTTDIRLKFNYIYSISILPSSSIYFIMYSKKKMLFPTAQISPFQQSYIATIQD